MSILYRGPPIDASYQVAVHLAKQFQRRRILKVDFFKSSPLKPHGQMNRNLVGSIYGRFSVKIAQKSANQKQESPVAAMFVKESGRNEQSLQRTFHRCFLPSFGSFGDKLSV
jgi:hypothetical protein